MKIYRRWSVAEFLIDRPNFYCIIRLIASIKIELVASQLGKIKLTEKCQNAHAHSNVAYVVCWFLIGWTGHSSFIQNLQNTWEMSVGETFLSSAFEGVFVWTWTGAIN